MSQSRTGIRVLVVDDEEDMCWVLRQIIEAEGHACAVARTAGEALREVERQAFDMAFVDVKLPDFSGFDLVRKIREMAADLPCVLVSGFLYSDDDLVRDGVASGLIAGFIGKPFLLTQIQEVLKGVAAATARDAAGPAAPPSGKPIPLGGIGGASVAAAATPRAGVETRKALVSWDLHH